MQECEALSTPTVMGRQIETGIKHNLSAPTVLHCLTGEIDPVCHAMKSQQEWKPALQLDLHTVVATSQARSSISSNADEPSGNFLTS
jgi:hypothetical protein